MSPAPSSGPARQVRLAYFVSHPIQYQAPLLRRIAQEPDIDLTVFFSSDHSVRAFKDEGFGVELAWDTPLLEGYRREFLPTLRNSGSVSAFSPISRGIYRRLCTPSGAPAFDAVWVHGYSTINSLHAILAANLLGIPVLLRAESWLADRARSPLKLFLKRLFLHDLRHLVAATLPIGTANGLYWQHYFGPDFPQFLMPYAVDNDFFATRAAAAQPTLPMLRVSLDIHPSQPVILFASKLQPRKHADHLLAAHAALLAQLDPSTPPPVLVIVGDGEQRAALEAQAHTLHIQDFVRFTGFQNQTALPTYFALASVFVLPSRHEPWGLIVNEAMAAGCPVIVSSDVGCAPDLITNGVEGVVFPVGEIPALTAALQHVLANHEAMSAAARARIATWSVTQDILGLRAALAHTTRKLRP